jgi:hypothetical protein
MSGENIKIKSNKIIAYAKKYDVGRNLKHAINLCIKSKTPLGRFRDNT